MGQVGLPHGRQTEFLAPRQVLFGAGTAASVGSRLRSWGVPAGRVLVVVDQVLVGHERLTEALAWLDQAGLSPVAFDEVAGEPTDEQVTSAVARAREHAVGAVIGIGGGSAMDLAKVTALLVTNQGAVADWFTSLESAAPPAPLALVPTTTGTGAEATRIAMITSGGRKRIMASQHFLPWVVALDADLVVSLPSAVVAATGLDALSHAIESLLSENRSMVTASLASESARILATQLPTAVTTPQIPARQPLLYAAHLAGLALNASVVLGHSLAYVIARRASLPHGTTCAMALPYCLAYNQRAPAEVTTHVAGLLTGGASDDLAQAARVVRDLAADLDQPTSLSAAGISADELDAMAAECVRDYPRPNNPVPVEEPRVRQLIEHMHSGDLDSAWRAMRDGRQHE